MSADADVAADRSNISGIADHSRIADDSVDPASASTHDAIGSIDDTRFGDEPAVFRLANEYDTEPADVEAADIEPPDAKPADVEPADVEPADGEPADAKHSDTEHRRATERNTRRALDAGISHEHIASMPAGNAA